MPIRRQDLSGLGHALPQPDVAELTGLRPFKGAPAVEVMRAEDRVAATSRRIVLSTGLRGDVEWRVPSTDPEAGSQTHPNGTTWYVVARGRVEVTPGCFFRVVGACVPSGETQRQNFTGIGDPWLPDGVHGIVRVTVVWNDRSAGSETSVHEVALHGSSLEFGAENALDGGFWRTLRNFAIEDIRPPSVPADTTELRRFSLHCTATITVEVQGSPRIVDLSVHEVPVAVAFDPATDGAYMTSHTFVPGDPNGPIAPPTHALRRVSATNPTSGDAQSLVTARAQALRLGPCLLQWSAYSETAASPTAGLVAVSRSNDAGVFASVLNSAHNGTSPYNATLPGWSMSCGGYARRWASANSLVLRSRIAVIPVIVRVYGRGITGGTSQVRVMTAQHSYINVPLAVAGSASWTTMVGWLEVGISPDQPTIGQVFLSHIGASGSCSVEAVKVYYNASAPAV